MATAFLRLPQVIQRTGISRSAIYKMVAEGAFPKPIRIGARAVAWVESDVESWSESRIVASLKEGAVHQRQAVLRTTER